MGWIRVGSPAPAKSLHNLAAKVEVEHRRATPTESDSTISSGTSTEPNDGFPVISKRTPEKDLPFISAGEVKKRDGKEGRRLCKFWDLPTLADTATVP
jgi:hypothetical protein